MSARVVDVCTHNLQVIVKTRTNRRARHFGGARSMILEFGPEKNGLWARKFSKQRIFVKTSGFGVRTCTQMLCNFCGPALEKEGQVSKNQVSRMDNFQGQFKIHRDLGRGVNCKRVDPPNYLAVGTTKNFPTCKGGRRMASAGRRKQCNPLAPLHGGGLLNHCGYGLL